ncbi:MAG: hypothetical protein WCA64_02770 [Gallionella sp.]
MKRIFLFVLTKLAVVFVINFSLRLLVVDRWLDQSGGINFTSSAGAVRGDRICRFAGFAGTVKMVGNADGRCSYAG